MELDAYGFCGFLRCGDRVLMSETRPSNWQDPCSELLQSYKFYLAFENAVCKSIFKIIKF